MKQYFCVGSYLPFESINKSQLNNSKAKQAFSFGKSKRFTEYKVNCNVVSYSKNQFEPRHSGTKIGTSQRQPIIVPNEFPEPGRYRVKTEPDAENHSFSFGLGRQDIQANNYLNIEAKKFPSSTKYQVEPQIKRLLQNAPVYSMRKKYPLERPEDNSPGPARYNPLAGKNSNLSLTKYKSVSFSTGKSHRFQNFQTDPPGPGAYREFNGNVERLGGGSSRFHSSLAVKFPHSKRKTYIDDQTQNRSFMPGPGNYRSPSEFGQYDGDLYQAFYSSKKRVQTLGHDVDLRLHSSQKVPRRPMTSKH